MVKRGYKREFRGSIGRQSALFRTPTPSPCVAYTVVRGNHDARLMLLEEVRREVLGAITAESIAAEGFHSFEEYRRYWIKREGRKFQPTREVFVYVLRPWEDGDQEAMGQVLFNRLYGEFTDAT